MTIDVEAVLFDMDGTLVDSAEVVETLWTEFAARCGVALPDVLAYSHGRPTHDTVHRFLPPGIDPGPVVADLQAREIERVEGIAEIAGAGRLLAALENARVAVVTSAPRDLAARRLTAAGLDVPAVLVTSEDVPVGKPEPAGYLRAAKLLGVAPSHCLAVEDAEAGIQAARAAGARTLVVGNHRSPLTEGLPRVPDLRAVTATVSPDGTRVRIRCRPPTARATVHREDSPNVTERRG